MAGLYNPEILKRVQQYELEILQDFIKVCEENDLSYFACSGTALGAVRHGGFIPWDDDIDVGMMRQDHDRLVQIFKRDYSEKYTVGTAADYEDYCMMNTHICLNDTYFCEKNAEHLKMPNGLFLDVFPFDNVPDDLKTQRKYARKAWFLSKLLILRSIPYPTLFFFGIKKKCVHFMTAFIHHVMKLTGVSHQKLYQKTLAACTAYNDQATQYIGYCTDTSMSDSIFRLDDIFPLQTLSFEDLEVCFPKEIHKLLTQQYGDYMTLPPVEKRHNHCPDRIKFPGEPLRKHSN